MGKIIQLEKGTSGTNPCPICGQHHPPQNRCQFEHLSKRVTLLLEANQIIPSLMQANKEAVTTAKQFQILLKKADEAHTVLMEVLAERGEIGEEIKNEYLWRLDNWAKETLNQNTEQLSLGIENSTSSEQSDKNSTETEPTETGKIILADS